MTGVVFEEYMIVKSNINKNLTDFNNRINEHGKDDWRLYKSPWSVVVTKDGFYSVQTFHAMVK